MDLSLNWLKEFVDTGCTDPREFSEKMTMSGSKVEGYTLTAEEIDKVVVGKVLEIEKHPDADKLVICQVDVGNETIQIVTGANNLTVGDLVPVALDGSTLPGGVKIKKGKLRGVVSNGMMCSLGELKLTQNDFPYAIENGIFVLQEECKPGDNIVDVLNLDDTIVEFEITPNRQDCLSVIGLAREAAVTFDKPLKLHKPVVKECGGDVNEYLKVEVKAPTLCTRYMARVVKDIKIEPSPLWLRERLRSMGVRPINNIVDITNYVMLEYGQPMHAFDYRFVKGNNIIVRTAENGEKITTLDDVERELTDKMLVIANDEGPMAIGGVMGGEYSGIMDDTTTIVFESACFYGASIRNTSRALALRTDASAKYEKGLDPQNCAEALDRACELIDILNCGNVVSGVIDVDNSNYTPATIKLEPEWINAFIGMDVSREKMVQILTDLDFKVDGDIITVPSYRQDVLHKADIAEEIARFYGYDKIETTQLKGAVNAKYTPEQKAEITINNTLLACGYSEISTFSFISPKFYDKMLVPADSPIRDSVRILNPLGEDTSIMRTFSLPSMMQVLATNYASRNMSAKLYEIATEYVKVEGQELPNEPKKVIIGAYGENYDYFDLKGAVEELIAALNIKDFDIEPVSDIPWYHPGRCAKLMLGGDELGYLGEIHPVAVKNYGIGTKVYCATLDFETLFKHSGAEKIYHKMPRFPATSRDLALICDKDLPVVTMEKAIKNAAPKLIEQVNLFDVYTGNQVESGKKSVAYNIVLRACDRTLTDEETDGAIKKILKALSAVGAELRM
ncbi:MAG: phenylalanine--tRNA ligase subunit beta [Acutalibacteraceae bacterium]|nr:phenylalanine--tRNA ligase subunit beta [Acutalibacteraceae bacterium]